MSDDAAAWIKRRTGKTATPALAELLGRANSVGFAWTSDQGRRWELTRYLGDSEWEEIIVWVDYTMSGNIGFKSAGLFHLTRKDVQRSIGGTLAWLLPREERD